MKPIKTFTVSPALPQALEGLNALAYNLFWTWHHDIIELFRRLGFDLWERCNHNPILVLGEVDQQKLAELAGDDGFMGHYARVLNDLHAYMSDNKTWYKKRFASAEVPAIAYFSAEFGLTECVPIYAGGLGILAGDHLKAASDLGLPLVGVGLLYQQGYFHQYLNPDGWQQESYPDNDFNIIPIQPVLQDGARPLIVHVPFPGRIIAVQVWRAQVGRVPLYLLDTNIDANNPVDQDITDQLYGGDRETRIRQEIILGIGGMLALKALGISPTVCHMNEGHSAFLAIERIRMLMYEKGLSFAEAQEISAAGHVFTTHTPVAAGHDYFEPQLMDKYFEDYYRALGLSRKQFLALGRQNPDDDGEPFCMTVLALKLAKYRNAVSRLHGKVSRKMWAGLWPNVPENEIPISQVTNGVHLRSWISKEMVALYDRYLGPRWQQEPSDANIWKAMDGVPAMELWRMHELRRQRLVEFVRRQLKKQLVRRGSSTAEIKTADEVLDPEILTIGFSRRFASYKRATLLLRDQARIVKLLTDKERPIQIVFAGKAHPQDNPAKELIREIVHFARRDDVRHRIAFIEDYNTDVTRYMVEGVDVWLNTPRRPREASGTSGMKAAINGVINLSTLDGWWDEAYCTDVGWAVGQGEEYEDSKLQDEIESRALYDILEKEVIPTFYDRGTNGLPRAWIELMKTSMKKLCPVYITDRMVREYTEQFYVPALKHFRHLVEEDYKVGRELAAWKANMRAKWSEVSIKNVELPVGGSLKVGDTLEVRAIVKLGELSKDEVAVQLYWGRLDTKGRISDGQAVTMEFEKKQGRNESIFLAKSVTCEKSGLHGFTLRILPHHPDVVVPWDLGLVAWA